MLILSRPTHQHTQTKNTTEESKYLWGNCSRRTLQLCHLAAPNYCPLRLAMEAGSSSLSLLCHPSAQDCQFHSHASVMWVGSCPEMPKLKDHADISACTVCVCVPIHNGSAISLALTECENAANILSANIKQSTSHTKVHESTHAYTFTHTEPHAHIEPHTRKPINTHTHTFVFTEPLLMMGGSMMFVCVPKELALLLGPNQQPTAAGY